jgi:hypothetical protein
MRVFSFLHALYRALVETCLKVDLGVLPSGDLPLNTQNPDDQNEYIFSSQLIFFSKSGCM